MKYKINDYVVMKKDHACGKNLWQITKCVNCNHEIMMDRLEIEKKLRRIVNEEDKKD